MEDILLSFVITAYNVQDCIEKCILSCVQHQIPKDKYELVIVDDGSTDDTVTIISHTVEKIKERQGNHKIKIVTQNNLGPGGARNSGLKQAVGKYVWWIDGDDIIIENAASLIIEKCLRLHLDVLCLNFQIQNIEGEIKQYNWVLHDVFEPHDGPYFLTQIDWVGAPWAYVFRRDYLLSSELFFIPSIFHEDEEFIARACYQSKRICFTNIIAYQYIKRDKSIMFQYTSKRACDLLYVCNRLWNYMNSYVSKNERDTHIIFIKRITILLDQLLMVITKGNLEDLPINASSVPFLPLPKNIWEDEHMNRKVDIINRKFLTEQLKNN